RRPPVLPQEDTLPGPEEEAPVGEWNGFTRASERHLDVARHVVRSFERVLEIRITFRNEPVQPAFEVTPRTRIGVLHDDHAAAGVLAENVHEPRREATFLDRTRHIVGELMGALPSAGYSDGLLVNGHDTGAYRFRRAAEPWCWDQARGPARPRQASPFPARPRAACAASRTPPSPPVLHD